MSIQLSTTSGEQEITLPPRHSETAAQLPIFLNGLHVPNLWNTAYWEAGRPGVYGCATVQVHTHTHTRTHTHIDEHIHTQTHAKTHRQTHTHTHTQTHTYTHTRTHTHTHTFTHSHNLHIHV